MRFHFQPPGHYGFFASEPAITPRRQPPPATLPPGDDDTVTPMLHEAARHCIRQLSEGQPVLIFSLSAEPPP